MENQGKVPTLEEVRNVFLRDQYATNVTGIEIADWRPGWAKVTLAIDDRHKNAAGRVMGAVYYTIADFAFAVANNAEPDRHGTVTLSSTIDYLEECRGTMLTAEAIPLRRGWKTSFYKVVVTDDTGATCAIAMTKGYRASSWKTGAASQR